MTYSLKKRIAQIIETSVVIFLSNKVVSGCKMLRLRISEYLYQNRRNSRTLKPVCVCLTRKAKAEYFFNIRMNILTFRYVALFTVLQICETLVVRGSVHIDP